eukprot:TRINITY_DN8292_c0_g1_i2.p1 TRINITY_DN8292_c0_g1~~TRINITY_DN8292_c0_g1_i2.p1  ORF type:complete len:341 (+),score=70.18 TRINITY_DN8292_c0_g1_i2:134-1156(+)
MMRLYAMSRASLRFIRPMSSLTPQILLPTRAISPKTTLSSSKTTFISNLSMMPQIRSMSSQMNNSFLSYRPFTPLQCGNSGIIQSHRSYSTVVTRIPAKTHIRALVFDEHGDFQEKDFAKSDLLPARDMRSIDPSFKSQMPTIFVREGAIVVNLEHIKAIIKHDTVLLFDYGHPSVQSFIPVMSLALKESISAPGTYSPYEFRALEAILTNVCAYMQRQLQTLTPAIIDVLDNLARDLNMPSLERLLPLNKSLTSFDVSVNEVKEAISAILNSNTDMANMYLSIRAQTGSARMVEQHDEMEMMLETYLQQVDEIVNDVAQLRMTVQSTQDYINLTLNRLG